METARLTGALVAILTLLVRGEAPGPATLAAAGVAGLVVFGALALGGPVVRQLLRSRPPSERPPSEG